MVCTSLLAAVGSASAQGFVLDCPIPFASIAKHRPIAATFVTPTPIRNEYPSLLPFARELPLLVRTAKTPPVTSLLVASLLPMIEVVEYARLERVSGVIEVKSVTRGWQSARYSAGSCGVRLWSPVPTRCRMSVQDLPPYQCRDRT